VDEHAERICEDAETFLTNNQTEDLHRLFSLFSELPKDQALISFKVSGRASTVVDVDSDLRVCCGFAAEHTEKVHRAEWA
jgi:hypothetical protein